MPKSFSKVKTHTSVRLCFFAMLQCSLATAQSTSDSLVQEASLKNIVQYAIAHQPAVRQALADEQITEKAIKGRLADWYPQVNFTYNYQRFFDLQSSVIGGNVIRFGVNNTSSAQLTATQNIFNRDVLLASQTASKVRIQADQNVARTKIDVVVAATKAFYDVLVTSQQIKVAEESIQRLQQSLKDAQSRYRAGVSDKTDYKRATILLGNAKASLTTNKELLNARTQQLKAVMGYPMSAELPVQYDTLVMESEVALDTLQQINFSEHIDYQILFMQRELQNANVKYSYWAFLPSVNAFGAYNLNYQNNDFGELYSTSFPYSFIGATLALPIFQGGKRIARIQEQKWVRNRLDLSLTNLQNNLQAEYARALASYKSNLANYSAQKENVALAKEVYDIVLLQYNSGVRAYLDVTVAETELQTTRINYFNALNLVLASKMDVLRALGKIDTNY
jgi:outer membrane protein